MEDIMLLVVIGGLLPSFLFEGVRDYESLRADQAGAHPGFFF